MSLARQLTRQLRDARDYFVRSSKCLTEEDSGFLPTETNMTVAQHVAHVAHTVDWFLDGAFRPEGFQLDFEAITEKYLRVESLDEARARVDKSFAAAIDILGGKSDEELMQPLPPGPVMGGAPRLAIVEGILDHTAHHRGALTVYARMCGHEPAMPYMDT